MIIGHLPAGYILAKLSHRYSATRIGNYRAFMSWGIFGAMAPDLDMLYFHLIDHGRTHHHKYFPHFPLIWFALIVLSACLFTRKTRRSTIGCYSLIFSVSGFMHLILDSIVGDIWWLAPYVDQPFALATVPARWQPWWLNFIFHWSFTLELAVVGWAIWLWRCSVDNSQRKRLFQQSET